MYAIKEAEIILKGTRNPHRWSLGYSIPKEDCQSRNYGAPNIYPGLCQASSIKPSTNTITFKPPSKSKMYKLPKDFQVFNSLVESNLCDQIIDQQIKQDTRTYTHISITSKNSSLAVLIRKKKK